MCENTSSSLLGREERGAGFAEVHSACVCLWMVVGTATVCCLSLPEKCLGGCWHPSSSMHTHSQLFRFASWLTLTFSLVAKCGPVLCKHTCL